MYCQPIFNIGLHLSKQLLQTQLFPPPRSLLRKLFDIFRINAAFGTAEMFAFSADRRL